MTLKLVTGNDPELLMCEMHRAGTVEERDAVVSWLKRQESGELMRGRQFVAALFAEIAQKLEAGEHRRG